jgi:hypothetical protein
MLNKPSVKEAASSRLGAEDFSIISYSLPHPFHRKSQKNRNKFQKSNSCTAKIQKNPYSKKPKK